MDKFDAMRLSWPEGWQRIQELEAANLVLAKAELESEKLMAELAELKAQKPVAWMAHEASGEGSMYFDKEDAFKYSDGFVSPLFTRPVPAIPEGYQLVPIDPTEAMFNTGNDVGYGIGGSPPSVKWIWEAILSAANLTKGESK